MMVVQMIAFNMVALPRSVAHHGESAEMIADDNRYCMANK